MRTVRAAALALVLFAAPASADEARANGLELVGSDPLQSRSAYQPHVHRYPDGRYILFVGHHAGQALDPQSGEIVQNGTSILDVTDPENPVYLRHLPGVRGAQMAATCNGSDLPGGDPDRVYLLRANGSLEHQVFDVTDPAAPELLAVPQTGLERTHRNWWQCDTGIAYIVSDLRPFGWSTRGLQVFDLSDPGKPRLIRNYALPGMQPGGDGDYYNPRGIHEVTVSRDGTRVYVAWGTGTRGVIQVLDNTKLVAGDARLEDPFAATDSNLLHPQLARLDMPEHWGAHTVFGLGRIRVAYDHQFLIGAEREILAVASESLNNECLEAHHGVSIVDFTDGAHLYPIATYRVRDESVDYCRKGGRFGAHGISPSYHEPFYPGFLIVTYFNAGVRVVDVRDPFDPAEIAFYIPATTANTAPRCITVNNTEQCKIAIQTNVAATDDRGLIYISDRANTGLHILRLAGAAKRIVAQR